MKNAPFRGEYSGFIMIGDEKSAYDGEKLVSYYATPFCGDAQSDVEKIIDFNDKKLIFRDVPSPLGREYDCIWEHEDVESVLDKIGFMSNYELKELNCFGIRKLVIPSACKKIHKGAFDRCRNLKEIILLGSTKLDSTDPKLRKIRIIRQKNIIDRECVYFDNILENDDASNISYSTESIPERLLWELSAFPDIFTKNIGVISGQSCIVTPHDVCIFSSENDNEIYYDRFLISQNVKKINAGSVMYGKWIVILGRETVPEDLSVAENITIYGFSGSAAEQYANKNGNTFRPLDGTLPDDNMNELVKDSLLNIKVTLDLPVNGKQWENSPLISETGRYLCSTRITFHTEKDKLPCGIVKPEFSFMSAYLIKNGYMTITESKVSNKGKGFITCDIIWKEPYISGHENYMYLSRIFDRSELQFLLPYFTSIAEFSCQEPIWYQAIKNLPDKDILSAIYLPDSRISCELHKAWKSAHDNGKNFLCGITPLKYTNGNCYELKDHFKLRVIDGQIECCYLLDNETVILSGTDRSIAKYCIDQYREYFYLPPIKLREV